MSLSGFSHYVAHLHLVNSSATNYEYILPNIFKVSVTNSVNLQKIQPHAFLVRSPCCECIPCHVISVLLGLIRLQVLNIFKTSNGRHLINIFGG